MSRIWRAELKIFSRATGGFCMTYEILERCRNTRMRETERLQFKLLPCLGYGRPRWHCRTSAGWLYSSATACKEQILPTIVYLSPPANEWDNNRSSEMFTIFCLYTSQIASKAWANCLVESKMRFCFFLRTLRKTAANAGTFTESEEYKITVEFRTTNSAHEINLIY